jgi:DNA helicase HerA-like ATPase
MATDYHPKKKGLSTSKLFTLDQVVAEGRKTGIFTCLITTNPAKLGGNILSQMTTQISGKTTNKEDIESIANMVDTPNTLPDLNLGEWIFNGIISNRPIKVHVN